MRRLLLCLSFLLTAFAGSAQYAPQAGIAGSTAISKNSGLFTGWATGCHVFRGLQQIGNTSLGPATLGDSSSALGAPNGDVVSLGDSGVAVLTFARPIINGPGADFAVFENGFLNTANPEEAFLELAFVEVSSDGVHFTRFPAISNTQDTLQLSPSAQPSYANARQLNNLAGKYVGGYGTPFDLAELEGTPGLDVNAITHVRLTDVIGSVGAAASRDANGHKINDPFPSPFPSSGFDLDAVGVLHAQPAGTGNLPSRPGISIFPNPAGNMIEVSPGKQAATVLLLDANGRRLLITEKATGNVAFNLSDLPSGVYFISVISESGSTWHGAFSHY